MSQAPRDPLEFTEFVTAMTPRLFRTALLLCGDWQPAENLVQPTWANHTEIEGP